jgi:hypothetical protein
MIDDTLIATDVPSRSGRRGDPDRDVQWADLKQEFRAVLICFVEADRSPEGCDGWRFTQPRGRMFRGPHTAVRCVRRTMPHAAMRHE